MVITEDGIVDYLVCPLRYAFLWHYGLDVPEPRRLYRQCVRSGLSALFRLLHEGRLNLDNLREVLKPEAARLPQPLQPFIDAVLVKYAAYMKDRRVLAYDLPVTLTVDTTVFAGTLDVLFEEEDVVAAAHVDDLPSSIDPRARTALMGLLQDGFQDSIRDEIADRGQLLDWRSLVLRGAMIQEESVAPTKANTAFLSVVGRCIESQAFHPRWHRASCRSCGFRPVCSAKWAMRKHLKRPKHTTKMLRARIKNESASS
jgi:hypothetical protein